MSIWNKALVSAIVGAVAVVAEEVLKGQSRRRRSRKTGPVPFFSRAGFFAPEPPPAEEALAWDTP